MAQVAISTCDICVGGPGDNYCEQCQQLFCDGCKISHLRTSMSKNHTFKSGPDNKPDVKQNCKEHDENFIYYCMECDTPVCKICAIKKHKTHDLSEIKESTKTIKSAVNNNIETKIRNLQSNIAKIDQGTQKYQTDVKEVIHAIQEEGRQLKELIEKKVEALIISIQANEAKNLQTLQSIVNEFQTALDKAKEQQKMYEDTQRIEDNIKMLQRLKQIKSEIKTIDEKLFPVMPLVEYDKRKATKIELDKLFGELTFGEIIKRKENMRQHKNDR
ncbi:Hypothetical predicted protein [Mytilus galloprovincialis]|uniref:B box-type domain-containing protein n=1 Tax=Mytilus galloprovincialis TaxID=29158 RepID=A0A8B6HRW0_MYTGA|nr:Hypothetical predicted protein [Mytilus galloprovincialis]